MKGQVVLCEVCGNEIDSKVVRCPFCGKQRSPAQLKKNSATARVINLEKGMPQAEDALKRMRDEINIAQLIGDKVLVFIHGYGSSGQGGVIRKEVRRQLQYLFDKKEINDFLPGEESTKRSGHFRQLVRRFPIIDKLVRKANPGITIVIL